ncbi:MAG: hypothetical protein LBD58_00520 [Treponema sp.]|nr:hypothetical protein [Treponema sp.]
MHPYKYEPKTLISRFFEFAALFALGCFLIRLGVRFLLEIRWILLIVFVTTAAAVIAYRVWRRNRGRW